MDAAPIRILHLVPAWEHVGALRRIATLAAHFDRNRYEFHVVALSGQGPDPRALFSQPLRCTAVAAGRRLKTPLAWRLRKLVHEWQADIVHAWTPCVTRIAEFALAGSRGVRLVKPRTQDLPPAADREQLCRQADAGPRRERLVEELALPHGARLLGTAGRLTRDKHVTELLWALDQIRCVRDDAYLLVIGDGEARPLFERYARLYEIADRVRFLGWRSDAAALIAAMDVYCSASTEPSCSLATLEAMALGVPVVASDTPAHRRVVIPGQTGFLADLRQRSELARWCLRVLEDGKLAARLSDAARRRVIEQFPVEPFVEAHRRLYHGVAGWHA